MTVSLIETHLDAERLPETQLVGLVAHVELRLGQEAASESATAMHNGIPVDTHLSMDAWASDALRMERVVARGRPWERECE